MSYRRTILTNTAALYALQVANYIFPLIVMPYLLRAIGVAAFGEIAFTGSVVLIFGAIIEFSFNYTATARIASRADDISAVSAVYSVVMATKIALMIGCTAILALLTATVPALREAWPLVFVQWPLLLGEVLFPSWLFQGVQKMTFVTVFHVISRVATLLLLFVFVHTPDDAVFAASIQASHYVIAGIAAQATARWMLGVRFQWPQRESYELVRDSARVFVSNVAAQVYVRSPMALVGLLASAPFVGAFAVAQKIASLFTSLTVPVTQSLYPHLCAVAERQPQLLARLRNKSVLGMALALSISVVCLNLCGDWVVALLSGEIDRSVTNMILLFSPVIVVTAINMMLTSFVLALRRFDEFKRITLAAAAVFLVLAFPLTFWFDAYGMIVTTLVVEIVVFACCLRLTRVPFAAEFVHPSENVP
ncbi:MAG: oligosaccharide flippase family protein [Deltaproteobacteria bacterium]